MVGNTQVSARGQGMAVYLKRGQEPEAIRAAGEQVSETVRGILADLEARGDAAVRDYSEKFDRWSPPSFRLSQAEIEALVASVPQRTIDDITFAQAQIRHFAKAQKDALKDIEVETLPGVTLGHKSIPVASVGCYVPGGRYPMVASAHMSIVTAKVAGVRRIVACTPPTDGAAHAETIAAMALGGADEIFLLGGVQAVGAMALGTATIAPVDMLVGPGNAYVAEAKRQLFGRVGIDLLAGPDRDPGDRRSQRGCGDGRDRPSGPGRARADLARHADHHEPGAGRGAAGRDRAPARRAADRRGRGRGLARSRPDPAGRGPGGGGRRGRQGGLRACRGADRRSRAGSSIACTNYGSLFLGQETNVAYGDKVIGTNHTLPTRGAARYTGGLWVGKFLKTVTYQQCTPEASVVIGEYCSRLCAIERFCRATRSRPTCACAATATGARRCRCAEPDRAGSVWFAPLVARNLLDERRHRAP